MFVFLTPSVIQTLHAFENHSHSVCTSKIEQHICDNDADCKLDVINKTSALLIPNILNFHIIEIFSPIIISPYNFLFLHQSLSYQLRGPPVFL